MEVLCPQIKDIGIIRLGIHPSLWGKIIKERKYKTLREIAKEYELVMRWLEELLRGRLLNNRTNKTSYEPSG